MNSFKDNFSKQSAIYALYRPHYPEALFDYLASLTAGHALAWDCGTGNGQAATALAVHYERVIATDPSRQQIENATQHPHIAYIVEPAEHSSLENNSADIVTIANALHWFDFDAFYMEVRRVVRPGGVIAAWAYGTPSLSPEVDRILSQYHYGTLGSYWRPENWLVDGGYVELPFPFPQEECPDFFCTKEMLPGDLAGYLNTWSATQWFIERNGVNPVEEVYNDLLKVWGDTGERKTARWKLTMRVGRVA